MGSSPESQLIISNGKAVVHPIAGTFRRSGDDETDQHEARRLLQDAKEYAEHVMLVDLARKDLSNFEFIVANSIEQAQEELEEDDFDLVIASSGHLEILKTIREEFSEKRVIVTTIQPTPQEAINVYGMGALQYFPTSFIQSAAEVSIDFKRAGLYSRLLNVMIPFFNPSMQGLNKFAGPVQ